MTRCPVNQKTERALLNRVERSRVAGFALEGSARLYWQMLNISPICGRNNSQSSTLSSHRQELCSPFQVPPKPVLFVHRGRVRSFIAYYVKKKKLSWDPSFVSRRYRHALGTCVCWDNVWLCFSRPTTVILVRKPPVRATAGTGLFVLNPEKVCKTCGPTVTPLVTQPKCDYIPRACMHGHL